MRQGEVYINGYKAGVITEHTRDKDYEFAYVRDYLENPMNPPVCLAMPLRETPYRSAYLFPYFFNMLSEGENRELQVRSLGVDKDDDFGLLLLSATHDTPGIVTVRPIDN